MITTINMLYYNLIQRADPRDRTLPQKWYATPASRGRIDIDALSSDIAGASSLSPGDIANVIKSLVVSVPKFLMLGISVDLGDLGYMRISFSSKGFENKEEFDATQIDDIKIIFTPSTKLKSILAASRFKAVKVL